METVNILIYVLDDQESELALIDQKFKESGIENYKLFSQTDLFERSMNEAVHLTIIDYMLHGAKNGLDVVKSIAQKHILCHNIIVSGMADLDTVMEFIRAGADDFIRKDKENYLDDLVVAVKRAFPMIEKKLELINKWMPPVNI